MDEEKVDYNHAVSLTAHLVAFYRGLEDILHPNDALIHDPYALVLGGNVGKEFFAAHNNPMMFTVDKALTRSNDMHAARTRIIDDTISSFVSSGVSQIVVMASGLDTRAWRMPFNPPNDNKICYFELDFEDVINYKLTKLTKAGVSLRSTANFEHQFVPVDLSNVSWSNHLLATKSFDPKQPTIWLIEGLTMYLTDEQLRGLLGTVHRLSGDNSKIIIDFMSHDWDGMVYSTTIGFVDDPVTVMKSMEFQGKFELYCDIASRYGRMDSFKGYGVFIGEKA